MFQKSRAKGQKSPVHGRTFVGKNKSSFLRSLLRSTLTQPGILRQEPTLSETLYTVGCASNRFVTIIIHSDMIPDDSGPVLPDRLCQLCVWLQFFVPNQMASLGLTRGDEFQASLVWNIRQPKQILVSPQFWINKKYVVLCFYLMEELSDLFMWKKDYRSEVNVLSWLIISYFRLQTELR